MLIKFGGFYEIFKYGDLFLSGFAIFRFKNTVAGNFIKFFSVDFRAYLIEAGFLIFESATVLMELITESINSLPSH